jgi:uncharacterized protein
MPRARSRAASLSPAIHDMVRRLAARWQPDKIILFGSYARGTADAESDADLLIVMPVEGRRRPIVAEMYGELADVPMAKDLVLVTPEGVERQRDDPGTIIYPALREGIVLYDRARAAPKRVPVGRAS